MWTVPLLRLETVARPRVGVAQIRQLARLCTILRWPGLLFGAIAGIVVPPPATVLLVLLIVWVAVYNSWGINMIPRASDGSILRIGRGLGWEDLQRHMAAQRAIDGVVDDPHPSLAEESDDAVATDVAAGEIMRFGHSSWISRQS